MRVDWVALYPEVESFQDGEIDLMDLGPISIGKVYNWIIEEDKKETTSNYDMIHLMENESKVNIGCLNAESHNGRMISIGNDVVTEGNTLLSDDEIEMRVVLHISSEFMEFMRSKYGNLFRQQFNVTIVRSDGEE